MQHLSRNPFCSRPVDPLLDALSGSREDICFLHPCSLIHEANSVSLLSAPSPSSSGSAVSAEATQACSGNPAWCGYYYGGGDGMSCISLLRLCIMFNSRMVPSSLLWLPPAMHGQEVVRWVCHRTHIHPHTLSPSLAGVDGKVWETSIRVE